MSAFILALLLASDPVSIHLAWEGGDSESLPHDAAVPGTDAPTPGTAAVERTLAREVPAAVVNTTVCRCQGYKEHLCLCLKAGVKCRCSRTVGSVWAVNESGVATHKTGAKADPRHAVTPTPVTPSTPPVATAPPAAADTKPAITITVAPFHCPPCNAVKAMDWSGFDVTWVTGGAVSAYPEISWKDKRGVKRILTGAYTPSRVRWSWERTQ